MPGWRTNLHGRNAVTRTDNFEESAMAETAIATRNEVTVVLLGQGESDYRARAQHYYHQAAVPCLALDLSSVEQSSQAFGAHLERALQSVTTAFVVLTLDADFVLPSALHSAAASLEQQPRAMAAQGYALGFVVGNAKVMYHKLGDALPALGEGGVLARLRQYGQAGRQAWRAVIRLADLKAALAGMPPGSDFAAFRLGLSYAILAQGEILPIEQTDVLCAYEPDALNLHRRGEQLSQVLRSLRQWDGEHLRLAVDDGGYGVLNRFVRRTYDHGEAPLLFTSTWSSVIDDPERLFEPRQYVEMPYYSNLLFAQLSALEFLCHALPAGNAQHRALEGGWVRQRHLAQVHPNDTAESLQLRYWQALALGLFDPQVCRQLVTMLTGPADGDRARELTDWLNRLDQIPGVDRQPRLQATASGRLLAALEAVAPDASARKRVQAHLAGRAANQVAFVVLDLANDDAGLQATFDSLLASGLGDFKLVVLKGGKPPLITTARDTLHFVQVNESNWVAHLNQLVRQLPSEWLLLLQAGDELLPAGLLHLMVELSESPACQAVCANEVQRDDQGRLHAVVRPGADVNLLRSLPDLMSRHWMVRRQAVLELGGYSESYRHALEFDLLLRMVEASGLGSLAHLDDYLVIGEQASQATTEEALKVLNRHLTQLGYRAQVREQQGAGFSIDFRHDATPLVSILVASEGDQAQLEACLTSVLQRTRYPRYEVLVACADHEQAALQRLGGRVRVLVGKSVASRSDGLNQAARQAKGEYLVLLSERCQVISPAWIEALLNEAQRPEVGVVGALLQTTDGALAHAGYALVQGPEVSAPWLGLSAEARVQVRWPLAVRTCAAVSGDCLMVSASVFEHCGGLHDQKGGDIELCLAAAKAGQLVVWTPQAQLQVGEAVVPDVGVALSLAACWPSAFVGRADSAPTLAWLDRLA